MGKVICIGSACKDIFFPTEEGTVSNTPEDILSQKKITFELGAKYKIDERFESLGGCAANVACGLAKFNVDSACYSIVGDDSVGIWIKDVLDKYNVGTDLITFEKNFPSDISAIIVEKKSGERVIFSNQKVNEKLEIVSEKINAADWIFIGDLHGNWGALLDEIVKIAKEKKIKIAYNPRQINIHDNVKKVIEIIPNTDILLLNKDESIEIVSQLEEKYFSDELNDEKFLIKKLKEVGSPIVAITDGSRGAWGFDGENLTSVPADKINSVDATGAGDAFSSGFLAAHIKGKSLEECVSWGIENGASVVQYYGGQAGLLDEKQVEEKIK